MKIRLSKVGIKNAIDTLDFLKDNITVASEEIVKQLVDVGFKTANSINQNAPQSNLTKSEVIAKITESKNKGYVALVGPGAIYDEFGTGEEGASDPHPIKNNFNLNPYNSGPYVSTHINQEGRHYWFYSPLRGKDYYDEESGYTEGIPSGKQIYNASKEVRAKKDKIVKQTLNKVVHDANNR